jgi:hypothetical protein
MRNIEAIPQRGIGAHLTVDGRDKRVTRLMKDCRKKLRGCMVPSGRLHVGLLSVSETMMPLNSDEAADALDGAVEKTAKFLAKLQYGSLELFVDTRKGDPTLCKYGSYWAVPVMQEETILGLRGGVAEIIKKQLGVVIGDEYSPHMSAVEVWPKQNITVHNNRHFSDVRVPTELPIAGFLVEVHQGGDKPPPRNNNGYVNRPRQLQPSVLNGRGK